MGNNPYFRSLFEPKIDVMIIGVPKEIKPSENRVGINPAGVLELTKRGHTVYVQSTAGEGSGFLDEKYEGSGATILPTIEDVYEKAEMIVKVKEPIEPEYSLVKEGQLVFTYFHFASSEPLTRAMVESGATCLAYETVEMADRSLPLLVPMSEVAGRMSIQAGAHYLEKPKGGKGILLGGIAGVQPAKVMVLGGGVVGTQAAKMAAGLGADVTILDINLNRLRELENFMPPNVRTLHSNELTIRELVPRFDLIIGAVLIAGAKAPNLITQDMLSTMKPGTVLVDVAVDQGGCIETTRPTTHDDPIFFVDDVLHYCVANMPGAVPYTSTTGLVNATLPYTLKLAAKGWKAAAQEDDALRKGLNVINGKIVYKGVAEAFDMDYVPVKDLL